MTAYLHSVLEATELIRLVVVESIIEELRPCDLKDFLGRIQAMSQHPSERTWPKPRKVSFTLLSKLYPEREEEIGNRLLEFKGHSASQTRTYSRS